MRILLLIIATIIIISLFFYIIQDIIFHQRNKQAFSFQSHKFFKGNYFDKYNGIIIIFVLVGFIFSMTLFNKVINIFFIFFITYLAISLSDKIIHKFASVWSYWLINLAYCVIILIFTLITLSSTWSIKSAHGINFLDHLIAIASTFIPILLISLIAQRNPNKVYKLNNKKTSKINHYREKGLSEEEIKNFRQEMSSLRNNIYIIEEEMNKTAKLRAIDLKYNTVNIAKQFFTDIVKEPNRLVEVGNLLYRTIPSLADLSSKYNEVNQHLAKTKQTYLILEKSAKTLEDLSESLEDEYLQFHQKTFNEINDEIKFAQRNLSPSNDWDEFEEGE